MGELADRPFGTEVSSKAGEASLLTTLCVRGDIGPTEAAELMHVPRRPGLALSRWLITSGRVAEHVVLSALAELRGARLVDLSAAPSDPDLAPLLDPATAVALSAVPYARVGGFLIVATCRDDLRQKIKETFPEETVLIALAPQSDITAEIGLRYGAELARQAESRAPSAISCRVWNGLKLGNWLIAVAVPLLAVLVLFPLTAQLVVFGLAGIVYLANMALKLVAAGAALRRRRQGATPRTPAIPIHGRPVISLLVPLFQERDVASDILARIDRLEYPRELLDVIFVLEEGDATTREALTECTLPHWARAITVPPGSPQTKPRALNYALPFARGSILGIYDAEDLPEPDQLKTVVARFAEAPPDLACLQGQLDYYNAGHNWLSRCFTIEYATWFRLLLPGVQHLGLVVPLGGTTLFLRREALLAVGGWDAHNVTEDAELGLRLARAGYRTDIIETTTFEEANSAVWPWIRQRARWLKGYAITWATAMRQPRQLWQDLGPRRFAGLQIQLAGTVLGFLTAPLLWTLALIPLGLPHPLADFLPPAAVLGIALFFAISLLVTLTLGWWACAAPHLRRHRLFLPAMILYFPLGSFATIASLVDLVARPFYWAKTSHGRYGARDVSAP